MAANESLYLDKPEILEYPTETWAAQDMRKSDVLQFAARHADLPDRAGFLKRADYFHGEALRMLGERATRFTARPRVLLMLCGYMRAAFQSGKDGGRAPRLERSIDFGLPIAFTPQKAIAKHRLVRIVLAAVLVGGIVAALTAGGVVMHSPLQALDGRVEADAKPRDCAADGLIRHSCAERCDRSGEMFGLDQGK